MTIAEVIKRIEARGFTVDCKPVSRSRKSSERFTTMAASLGPERVL